MIASSAKFNLAVSRPSEDDISGSIPPQIKICGILETVMKTESFRGSKSTGSAFFVFDELILKSAKIFVIVKGVGGEVSDISEIRGFIDKIKTKLLSSEGKEFDYLKKEIIKIADSSPVKASFILGHFSSPVFSVLSYKNFEAAIIRNNLFSKIVSVSEKPVALSGYPNSGDILLMADESIFSKVDEQEISKICRTNQLAKVCESILEKVSEGGLYLIEFKIDEEREEVADTVPQKTSAKEKIKENLVSFLDFLISKIPEKHIYIQGLSGDPVEKNKRGNKALVGLGLLALLTISVIFGGIATRERKEGGSYKSKLDFIEHKLNESKSLYGVDMEKSRSLYLEAEKLAKETSVRKKDDKLPELRNQISELRGKILGEYNSQESLFLDLSLVESGFTPASFYSTSSTIYILDTQGKKMVEVTYPGKRTEVVLRGDVLDSSLAFTVSDGKIFLLKKEGIDLYEENLKKGEIKADWGDPVISSYSGNLYLLDKSDSKIYRFSGGVGSKELWLGSDVTVDLLKTKSIAIDGSVWMGTEEGEIYKFSQGRKIPFGISGLSIPLSIKYLYTNEELDNLYVKDEEGVAVIGKNGDFIARYTSEGLREANFFSVSEKAKILVFLKDNKLYSIELKHLN